MSDRPSLASFRKKITPGTRLRVDNYYRPEVSRDTTVVKNTSHALHMEVPPEWRDRFGGQETTAVDWPPASLVSVGRLGESVAFYFPESRAAHRGRLPDPNGPWIMFTILDGDA